MSATGYEKLRRALIAAMPDPPELDFKEQPFIAGAVRTSQLHAQYKSGNEYINLDKLLTELRKLGSVSVFEFRGRGADEKRQLIADVTIDSECYQLVYHLE